MEGWTPHGNRQRCYIFWREYSFCLSQAEKVNNSQCYLLKEDYLECLNGWKEVG